MQTFLPYADFEFAAACLDDRRLRAQTWEARTVYRAVTGQSTAWARHCIVRLWQECAPELLGFWECCADEAEARGLQGFASVDCAVTRMELAAPGWVFERDVVLRYRQHLLAKDPVYYGKFHWRCAARSGYWAPNKLGVWQIYSGEDRV